MPPCSRRALLGAGAAGAAAALAGCVSGGSASFEPWTPESGTWPLARYGPGNSGHNPNASPPRDEVETAWQIQTDVSAEGLVVAYGRLAAYGRQGLVVALESYPDDRWREFVPAEAVGFGPRDDDGQWRLYAAGELGHQDDTTMALVRGWRYRTERWQSFRRSYEVDEAGGGPQALVSSADALYVGHPSGPLVSFDASSGDTRWRASGMLPALGAGRLVAGGSDSLTAYRPRSGIGARLNGGPAEAWTASAGDDMAPALVDGRMFAGRFAPFGDMPTLYGYDMDSGEELWDPLALGEAAGTPAVIGDTGYVGVSGSNGEPDALAAVDLDEGAVEWRRETGWRPRAVAGGEDVVVAYGSVESDDGDEGDDGDDRGRVRAYDAGSGDSLWTHTTSGPVDSVALVESTVYVGSRDGTVTALRAE